MRLPEPLKERLIQGIITGFLGALGYALSMLAADVTLPLIDHVWPAVTRRTLLWLCLTLLLVLGGFAWWVWWLHQKEEMAGIPKGFTQDLKSGMAVEDATGKFFCSRCLIQKRKSQLYGGLTTSRERNVETHAWHCKVKECGGSYLQMIEIQRVRRK